MTLRERIAEKKAQLDALRPVSQEALRALQKSFDVDLTYTSNAIEGNTLTLRETAELIEHGITVVGKPLRDHLEALDHYDAVLWTRELAAEVLPGLAGTCLVDGRHRAVSVVHRRPSGSYANRIPSRNWRSTERPITNIMSTYVSSRRDGHRHRRAIRRPLRHG